MFESNEYNTKYGLESSEMFNFMRFVFVYFFKIKIRLGRRRVFKILVRKTLKPTY